MFQRIIMNLTPTFRMETLNARQYMAIPTIMLTQGVHNGSEGPLLYLNEEMSRFPVTWNHKPVVIYHPTLNGDGISACDPDVVEKQSVGLLFKSGFDSKLKTEVWADEEKLKTLSLNVYQRIQKGEPVEVSTGLFHQIEKKSGEFEGQPYVGIVRNIQPDHLAILPDQIGACSIAKGAGLLMNSAGKEVSYSDVRQQIQGLLMPDPNSGTYMYVADIFPKFAVYEKGNGVFKIGYKISKEGVVSLSGEPEEVRLVRTYVTANNLILEHRGLPFPEKETTISSTNNQEPTMATNNNTPAVTDARKASVGELISKGGWKEDDRSFLEGLGDGDFSRVAAVKSASAVPPPAAPPAGPVIPAGVTAGLPSVMQVLAPAVVGNATPQQPQTVDQWLQTAPPQFRGIVQNLLANEQAERTKAVDMIFNTQGNRFTKEFLMQKPLPELQGILALLQQQTSTAPVHNYAGQAEVPMFQTAQVVANQGGHVQKPIPMQTLDFEAERKKRQLA